MTSVASGPISRVSAARTQAPSRVLRQDLDPAHRRDDPLEPLPEGAVAPLKGGEAIAGRVAQPRHQLVDKECADQGLARGDHEPASALDRRKPELDHLAARQVVLVGEAEALVPVEGLDMLQAVALVSPADVGRTQIGGLSKGAIGRRQDTSAGRAGSREQTHVTHYVGLEGLVLHGDRQLAGRWTHPIERVDVAGLERGAQARREALGLEDGPLAVSHVEGRAGPEAGLWVGNAMGVDLIFTIVSITYRHTIAGM